MRILVVDDQSSLRQALGLQLRTHGYEVIEAADAAEALAQFQAFKPDLILLDVMMPNMDGFTLAEEIRNVDPDVPLFFLSAKSMKDDILTGYKLGADDYITKPMKLNELENSIRRLFPKEPSRIDVIG